MCEQLESSASCFLFFFFCRPNYFVDIFADDNGDYDLDGDLDSFVGGFPSPSPASAPAPAPAPRQPQARKSESVNRTKASDHSDSYVCEARETPQKGQRTSWSMPSIDVGSGMLSGGISMLGAAAAMTADAARSTAEAAAESTKDIKITHMYDAAKAAVAQSGTLQREKGDGPDSACYRSL